MEKKIILQRTCENGDGWNCYKEQVSIDEKLNLDYRCSSGGNCEYGTWGEWEGEKEALYFIFDEIKLSDELIENFKKELFENNKTLLTHEFNMANY